MAQAVLSARARARARAPVSGFRSRFPVRVATATGVAVALLQATRFARLPSVSGSGFRFRSVGRSRSDTGEEVKATSQHSPKGRVLSSARHPPTRLACRVRGTLWCVARAGHSAPTPASRAVLPRPVLCLTGKTQRPVLGWLPGTGRCDHPLLGSGHPPQHGPGPVQQNLNGLLSVRVHCAKAGQQHQRHAGLLG